MTATRRITWTWAALCLLTVGSWALARSDHGHRLTASTLITVSALAVSAVKVRLILRTFMEVRTCPTWVRRFTDVWLAVFSLTVLVTYLW